MVRPRLPILRSPVELLSGNGQYQRWDDCAIHWTDNRVCDFGLADQGSFEVNKFETIYPDTGNGRQMGWIADRICTNSQGIMISLLAS